MFHSATRFELHHLRGLAHVCREAGAQSGLSCQRVAGSRASRISISSSCRCPRALSPSCRLHFAFALNRRRGAGKRRWKYESGTYAGGLTLRMQARILASLADLSETTAALGQLKRATW